MPRGKQSKGRCSYCETEVTKSGIAKHLATCGKRHAVISNAEQRKESQETLSHLRVQDAWRPDFWLDLEIGGSQTLKDLDFYTPHG